MVFHQFQYVVCVKKNVIYFEYFLVIYLNDYFYVIHWFFSGFGISQIEFYRKWNKKYQQAM